MLVDDDPHNHKMIKLFLKEFSFEGKPLEFVSAFSGAEACSLLQQHSDVALIFLDLVMEELDSGLQVARYVRDELGNSLVRIVMLTGQVHNFLAENIISQYNINDYKLKTEFTRQKLSTTVLAWLRDYRDLITLEANRQELSQLTTNMAAHATQLESVNAQLEIQVARRQQAEARLQALLAVEHEQRLLAETLSEVTLALTAPTNQADVLQEILRQMQRLVPYQCAHIVLLHNNVLRVSVWQGYPDSEFIAGLEHALADFPVDAGVVRSRAPLVIADTQTAPGWVVELDWVRSHLSFPIVLGQTVLGLLRMDADTPNAFSQQDVARLQPLVHVAAVALERVRLYDQLQQELAERVQTQKAILEQRNLLRTVIDTVPDFIFVKDTASRFVLNNEVHLSVLGAASQEEVLGKTDFDFFSPELAQSYYTDEQNVINCNEQLLNREEPYTEKDTGALCWLSTTKVPLFDSNGQVTGLVGRSRDITEQKQTEEELRQYEFIVNTSNELMTLIDRNHIYAAASSAYCQAHGRSRAQIVGQSVASVWGWNIYEQRLRAYLIACFEGRNVQYDEWIEFGVLGRRYVQVSCHPYTNSQGVVTHAVVVSKDITDFKQTEAALQQANAQKEQLLAAIPSILIGVNGNNIITHWNAPAAAVFQIDVLAAMGLPLSELPWDWAKVKPQLEACRAGVQPINLHDVRYTRSDGKEGFLKISITPYADSEAQSAGLLLLAEDITERKILESQLAQAQKLQAVGHLAAGIAHEINTPTQYIGDNVGFLQVSLGRLQTVFAQYQQLLEAGKTQTLSPELLAEVEDAARQARVDYLLQELPLAAAEAMNGVARVTDIVKAMKEFSHPGVEEAAAININQAIQSTITVARTEWKYVANLDTDFDPDLPPVLCLPGEFNQVILNILINASQAIAEVVGDGSAGKGVITVTTRRDGNWAEIRISDTGPGIPNEIKPRIFDPFFTTKEVGRGTGQGLAISHAVIVEKHRGSITVESALGSGSTFIIRLPINPDSVEVETPHG